jgi:hypothetical protein
VQRRSLLLASLFAVGCGLPPPKSQPPTADDAIARMRASVSCGNGVQVTAKIDHFGKQGRVRGDLWLYAMRGARLRMDAISPFGVNLATLTTDGQTFSLADLREKQFYVGPAKSCNLARLTTVPIPGPALVGFLRGEAPVLVHDKNAATIEWRGKGHYLLRIPSTRGAEELLALAPHPDDRDKPWQEQRLRVTEVTITQQGYVLYHAELSEHAAAPMALPRIDEAGIDPPVPPSGPQCTAELPRKIHLEVPGGQQDVLFRYDQVTWNPPLTEGLFAQPTPAGMPISRVDCEE